MMTATPVTNSSGAALPVPQAAPIGAPAQKEGLFLSILGKAVQENLPKEMQNPALSLLQAKDPLAPPEEDTTASLPEEEGKQLSHSDIPLPCMAVPDPAIQWAKGDSPEEADHGIGIQAGQKAPHPMGAKQKTFTPTAAENRAQTQAVGQKRPEDPAGLQRGEKLPAEKAPVQPAGFRTGGKEQFSPAEARLPEEAQANTQGPQDNRAEFTKAQKANISPADSKPTAFTADGQKAPQGVPPFLAALQANAAKENGRAAYELKTPASGKNPLHSQSTAAQGETLGAPKAYDPLGGFSLEKITADGQKGETGDTSLMAGAKSSVHLRKTLSDGGGDFSEIKIKTEKTQGAEGTGQTPYAQLFKGTGEIKFQPASSDSPQGANTPAYAQVLDKITGCPKENGTQKIRMKLYPEGLGELHITLTCKEDTVSVHILAETAAAAKLLESQAGELRGALLTKNYEVSALSFDTRSDLSGQANSGFSFFGGNTQENSRWQHEAYPLFDGAEALQSGEETPLPVWTNISAGRINFWA